MVDTMFLNSRELTTFSAAANDGASGSVRDLLIDDDDWLVQYIVVDTEGFLTDNNVVLSTRLAENVQLPDQVVTFALSKASMMHSAPASQLPPVSAHHNEPETLPQAEHDEHLRSAVEIGEYTILASDGELGRARGLVIEVATWTVRYVVVDTGEVFGSKQVLLAPSTVRHIDWEMRKIETNLTSAAVHACPEYDIESEITRQYEAFLHNYYGWRPYWQED